MSVIIETTVGDVTIDLYVTERPRSCLNFLKLCKVKYYNNCLFHSVQRSFIAQTGDPTGTGRGGESIFRMVYGDQAKLFDAEKVPKIKHKRPGMVSMVNDGNGFHGSQFLFTLADNLDSLDGLHTVFGEVAEGMDVLMKINEAFCDKNNRPYQDIRITHTVVLDDPLDDPVGLIVPERSPEPSEEQIEGCFRIGADEVINDDEGMDEEDIKKRDEVKEAKHSAQVLEIIGDIPDKDVKPPDNVLFVCKLNAVTTDEDLEIIFSRFGTILSCEIIRDYKTGDSLQYAFIEFETAEMCEKAYHKMDNVLIDDRRIHVDFSQSVSKVHFPRTGQRGRESPSSPPRPRDDKRDRHGNERRHQGKRRHTEHSPRRHRSRSDDGTPERSHRSKKTSPSWRHAESREERKRMKKERKRRRSRSSSSQGSDEEVRCGKHRKRSVQKDDHRKRLTHKSDRRR